MMLESDGMHRAKILDGYLARLGLERNRPDLPFLSTIVSQHVARLAFCSIGPLLGDELALDLEALYQRLIVQRRGGYCFEQNGLLYEMLEELGFRVQLCLARVIYNQNTYPGLTHRISLVQTEAGSQLVDVGFGPQGPRLPVRLDGTSSEQGIGLFRVSEPDPGHYHLQTLKDQAFFSLYRFELARYGEADCELGHFYSHRHPKAVFVNNLVVSRILEQEIRSMRNRDYWSFGPDGDRKVVVETAEQLRKLLAEDFEICVSEAESRAVFAKLPAIGTS